MTSKEKIIQEAIDSAVASVLAKPVKPAVAPDPRVSRFVDAVNAAEAKPITEASHQELQALAAAAWG